MPLIIEQRQRKLRFVDLKPGDIFKCWEGEREFVFMRVCGPANTVNLIDGVLLNTPNDASIIPAKGRLTVEV